MPTLDIVNIDKHRCQKRTLLMTPLDVTIVGHTEPEQMKDISLHYLDIEEVLLSCHDSKEGLGQAVPVARGGVHHHVAPDDLTLLRSGLGEVGRAAHLCW